MKTKQTEQTQDTTKTNILKVWVVAEHRHLLSESETAVFKNENEALLYFHRKAGELAKDFNRVEDESYGFVDGSDNGAEALRFTDEVGGNEVLLQMYKCRVE